MSDPKRPSQAASSGCCSLEPCEHELARRKRGFSSRQLPNVIILREPPAQNQAAPSVQPPPQQLVHFTLPSALKQGRKHLPSRNSMGQTPSASRRPPPLSHWHLQTKLRPCITVVAATSTSPKALAHSQLLKCYQIREHRCRQRLQVVEVEMPVRMS